MNEISNQTATLLPDLERKARLLQECTDKLETQLKVMLLRECRGHSPNELAARIANALALCLVSRGDLAQAGQYATMAANLGPRHDQTCPPRDEASDQLRTHETEAKSDLACEGTDGSSVVKESFGQSLRRQWRPRRGPWFGAWGWLR